MVTIFVDECGYTGEDLLNVEQQIFVISSLRLSNDECKFIKKKFFSGVRSKELKHTKLIKSNLQKDMIINFFKYMSINHKCDVCLSVAHKRFALVTKIVDLIIETLMYDDGIDLYDRGGNIALSNIIFILLNIDVNKSIGDVFLQKFQRCIRERTMDSYKSFFDFIINNRFESTLDEFIDMVRFWDIKKGFEEINKLPNQALDVAFTGAFVLAEYWSRMIGSQYSFVHDESSNMSKNKYIWDILVDKNIEKKVVGYDRRKIQFSLHISETRFEKSEYSLGLQLADIMAGAVARWAAWKAGQNEESQYVLELDKIILDSFDVHPIWPTRDVTPEALETTQENAENHLEFISQILEKKSPGNS